MSVSVNTLLAFWPPFDFTCPCLFYEYHRCIINVGVIILVVDIQRSYIHNTKLKRHILSFFLPSEIMERIKAIES